MRQIRQLDSYCQFGEIASVIALSREGLWFIRFGMGYWRSPLQRLAEEFYGSGIGAGLLLTEIDSLALYKGTCVPDARAKLLTVGFEKCAPGIIQRLVEEYVREAWPGTFTEWFYHDLV